MSAAPQLASLMERLKQARSVLSPSTGALGLGHAELDAFLPDGGLPHGVIELRSAHMLGGVTEVAMMSVRATHSLNDKAWCAWIDPEGTLYAPRLLQMGVDLDRLLIVRPPRDKLERIALRVATSGAFDLVVIDMDTVRGAALHSTSARTLRPDRSELFVRKLSLAADKEGTRFMLLTDAQKKRAMPWPVALRLELEHAAPDALSVRITKERHGRMGSSTRFLLDKLTG